AARSLGASPWRVVVDVLVPGLKPALISAGAICFATAMGAFGTAFTLATRINVLPITIYTEFTNYANFTVAAALSIVLGVLTALALILLYGQIREFRTSWTFILVGHVLFTLPFMVRSVVAVMAAIDLKTLEDAAASLGATFRQRFFNVVLPNARPGIVAGSLMVVTLSMGEFNITWMLHTPLTQTLPVGLADSYASMRLEIGSAYTVIFFFMIVPL